MNGPQHYAEAEHLLKYSSAEHSPIAHAILALVAAVIDAHDNQPGLDESGRSLRQWRDVNDDDAEEGFRTVPTTDWARVIGR